jgi:tetratricopeptide (TPR) repeat protein
MHDQSLAAARGLVNRGAIEEARRLLAETYIDQPTDANLSHLLGVCDFREGKFVEAERHFRRAISLPNHSVDSRYYIGLCLERRGVLEEAKTHFLSVLALDPTHVNAKNKIPAGSPMSSGVVLDEHPQKLQPPSKAPIEPNADALLAEVGLTKGIYTEKKSKLVYHTERVFGFIFGGLFFGGVFGAVFGAIAYFLIGPKEFEVLSVGVAVALVVGIGGGVMVAGQVKKVK